MVLHLDVALSEPGSGIVHQDETPGQWFYTLMLHSMNLGVALCIKTGLLANGVTPECCTQLTWEWQCASRRDSWQMVLHLNVALDEPGSGSVHQDGTPGQLCYT